MPETAEFYVARVIELEETLRRIRGLEAIKDDVSAILKDGLQTQGIDEDTIKAYGLSTTHRIGGVDDSICGLLKQKEFRDAVVVKETADQKQVKELVASGQLTDEEVEPYKKPDSIFFSLPRGKS